MDTSFQEIKDILKENSIQLKNLEELQAKNEAKSEKEFERLREVVKDTRQEIGGIGNSLGDSLEYSFLPL